MARSRHLHRNPIVAPKHVATGAEKQKARIWVCEEIAKIVPNPTMGLSLVVDGGLDVPLFLARFPNLHLVGINFTDSQAGYQAESARHTFHPMSVNSIATHYRNALSLKPAIEALSHHSDLRSDEALQRRLTDLRYRANFPGDIVHRVGRHARQLKTEWRRVYLEEVHGRFDMAYLDFCNGISPSIIYDVRNFIDYCTKDRYAVAVTLGANSSAGQARENFQTIAAAKSHFTSAGKRLPPYVKNPSLSAVYTYQNEGTEDYLMAVGVFTS